jgi:hypothetical protein
MSDRKGSVALNGLRGLWPFGAGAAERRLEGIPHLAALLMLAVAIAFSPTTKANDTQHLSAFYATVAAILATLLVAAALFQGLPASSVSYETRRFLGKVTFAYLGIGIAASVTALSDTLPLAGYRYVFVLTLTGGGGALVAVLLLGARSIAMQGLTGVSDRVNELTKPAGSVSVSPGPVLPAPPAPAPAPVLPAPTPPETEPVPPESAPPAS